MSADAVSSTSTSALQIERELLALVDTVASELHRGHLGLAAAGLDSSLERDLAIDSLARVELGVRIERCFGHRLADERLFEADTPRELLQALATAGAVNAPDFITHAVAPQPRRGATGLPQHARNLVEMLAWHVERNGTRTHIQLFDDAADGPSLSYRALWDGAAQVAAGLQHRGLELGARVALMLPSGTDYFFAFYGVLLAGGVPVPIYPPVRRAQLEDHLRRQGRILANCQAAVLITSSDALLVSRLLTAAVTSLGVVTTVEELSAHGADFERAAPAPDALAFLQYTSGSTGDPKGRTIFDCVSATSPGQDSAMVQRA